jgi:hypothetical protein
MFDIKRNSEKGLEGREPFLAISYVKIKEVVDS